MKCSLGLDFVMSWYVKSVLNYSRSLIIVVFSFWVLKISVKVRRFENIISL